MYKRCMSEVAYVKLDEKTINILASGSKKHNQYKLQQASSYILKLRTKRLVCTDTAKGCTDTALINIFCYRGEVSN